MNESKTCHKCGQLKLLDAFCKNTNTRDGLQSQCKSCNRVYRQLNKERIVANNRARYHADVNLSRERQRASHHNHKAQRNAKSRANYQANREQRLKQQKEYRSKNLETYRQKSRDWRSANKQRLLEQGANWRKANPEVHRQAYHRRRAMQKQNGVFIILHKELKRLYSSPCNYCGAKQNITADHVVPIARGGRHSIGNLVPCCKSCNSRKQHSYIMEWRKKNLPR